METCIFPSHRVPTSQGPEVDANEAMRMQAWHDETRWYRNLVRRRSRIVAKFLKDPAMVRKAAELSPPRFGDRVIDLEGANVEDGIANLFKLRISARREDLRGAVSLEQVASLLGMAARSTRTIKSDIADISFDLRPYPSGGALYPCELFVIIGGTGEYAGHPLRYDARRHTLICYGAEPRDYRSVEMHASCAPLPCAIVIAAVLSRATAKYGPRGYRFALLEAGHLGQNLVLAATTIGLPSLVSGSYFDKELERWLGLDGLDEVVLSTVLLGGIHEPPER